jgi:hypothetical protein
MKKQYLLTLGGAVLLLVGSASCVSAQDSQVAYTPENSSAAAAVSKIKNVPASQPHKVWTDDNVSSVRSDADKYQDQKKAEADDAAAANTAASKAQAKAKEPEPKIGGAPALSAPKSPEDAQRMIEWEDRDIDAQQEFLDKLRDQYREANTFEERERLEKLINERIGIIAQTKKERDALVAQKQEKQKKEAVGPNANAPGTSNQ